MSVRKRQLVIVLMCAAFTCGGCVSAAFRRAITNLQSAGAQFVTDGRVGHVRVLDLKDEHAFGDDDLSRLAEDIRTLKPSQLGLSRTAITDESAPVLATFSSVESVSLEETGVTMRGIELIAASTSSIRDIVVSPEQMPAGTRRLVLRPGGREVLVLVTSQYPAAEK